MSPRLFFPRAFKASTKRTTSLPSENSLPAAFLEEELKRKFGDQDKERVFYDVNVSEHGTTVKENDVVLIRKDWFGDETSPSGSFGAPDIRIPPKTLSPSVSADISGQKASDGTLFLLIEMPC